jgi:vancomycin resistance protein YoaR
MAGFIWRLCAAGVIGGAAAGAVVYGVRQVLPRDGAAALGVRIAGSTLSPTVAPRAVAEAAAKKRLARRVVLTFGGKPIVDATLAALGARVDVDSIEAAALSVGRTGDLFRQLDECLHAREGHVDIPVRIEMPIEPLAQRLERAKEELDTRPVASRLDLTRRTATPHRPGRYMDVYAAAAAIDRAVADAERTAQKGGDQPDEIALVVPLFEIAPRASSEVVAKIDTSLAISRFETRFGYLGGQQNRAQNIARAASQMDGVVLMPGDVVSFNANVGPRSIENGFATAPEIWKGEMREGIGGGTCQVAGTLHAAAFFAGLDISERANHSRPSGYIRMGLDATVVYPTVDLKLRNPYDFPIVLKASLDKGTLTFELRGRERPANVTFATETLGVSEFKRKVEEKHGLPEGKFVLKQKGIKGYSIRKTRVIQLRDGRERVEVTTDTYPPTFEIYLVPPGTDPSLLPPGPDAGAPADGRTASFDARPEAPAN